MYPGHDKNDLAVAMTDLIRHNLVPKGMARCGGADHSSTFYEGIFLGKRMPHLIFIQKAPCS